MPPAVSVGVEGVESAVPDKFTRAIRRRERRNRQMNFKQYFVENNFKPVGYTSERRPEPTGRNSFYERTAIPPELLFRDDSDDVMRPLFIKHPGQRRGRRRALVGFVFIVLLSMCSFIVFVRIWNGAEETAIISAVDYPSPRPTLTPSYAPTVSPSASSADEPDEEEDEEEASEEETGEEEPREEETSETDTSEDEVDADEFSDEEETGGETEEPDARRFLRAPDPAHTS